MAPSLEASHLILALSNALVIGDHGRVKELKAELEKLQDACDHSSGLQIIKSQQTPHLQLPKDKSAIVCASCGKAVGVQG